MLGANVWRSGARCRQSDGGRRRRARRASRGDRRCCAAVGGPSGVVGAVGGGLRPTTVVRGDGAGGPSTSGAAAATSRPMRRRCAVRTHGVTAAEVPWARHGAGHTRAFDDTVAWLAIQCSKCAVVELMRIAWRSVGAIVDKGPADIDATVDRLAGLCGSGSTRSATSAATATSP